MSFPEATCHFVALASGEGRQTHHPVRGQKEHCPQRALLLPKVPCLPTSPRQVEEFTGPAAFPGGILT